MPRRQISTPRREGHKDQCNTEAGCKLANPLRAIRLGRARDEADSHSWSSLAPASDRPVAGRRRHHDCRQRSDQSEGRPSALLTPETAMNAAATPAMSVSTGASVSFKPVPVTVQPLRGWKHSIHTPIVKPRIRGGWSSIPSLTPFCRLSGISEEMLTTPAGDRLGAAPVGYVVAGARNPLNLEFSWSAA